VTTAATFFLGMAAVFALADWVAVGRRNKALEYVAKPAALLALIGVAATLVAEDESRRGWFLVALVLCLAGDVFLMLPRDLFIAGLAAFLLGHLAYVGGFGLGDAWPAVVAVAAVAAVVAAPVVRALRARGDHSLLGPVLAYMAVITVMVACAIGSGDRLAAAGAILFMASDSLIAYRRFVWVALPVAERATETASAPPERPPERRDAVAGVAIMVLYHLGQAGLVLSLLR
jgi:uncharacterized membrane protein YhhN